MNIGPRHTLRTVEWVVVVVGGRAERGGRDFAVLQKAGGEKSEK